MEANELYIDLTKRRGQPGPVRRPDRGTHVAAVQNEYYQLGAGRFCGMRYAVRSMWQVMYVCSAKMALALWWGCLSDRSDLTLNVLAQRGMVRMSGACPQGVPRTSSRHPRQEHNGIVCSQLRPQHHPSRRPYDIRVRKASEFKKWSKTMSAASSAMCAVATSTFLPDIFQNTPDISYHTVAHFCPGLVQICSSFLAKAPMLHFPHLQAIFNRLKATCTRASLFPVSIHQLFDHRSV